MLARDERAFHPSIDPTAVTVEARYADFRVIAGVEYAFLTEQWDADSDEWLGTTRVEGMRVDPDLSAVRFDLSDLAAR